MLIKNIKELILNDPNASNSPLTGSDLNSLHSIRNAWLETEGDRIKAYGKMDAYEVSNEHSEVIDAENKILLPTWVDSHTHLVFAASREEEFVMRLKGKSYEEIGQITGFSASNIGTRLNRIKAQMRANKPQH